MAESPAAFIEGLPKAELHVHLEGTLEPELMLQLAERHGVRLPWDDLEQIRASYTFTDLSAFLGVYFAGCGLLREEQDFYDLTSAYLERAARDQVRRAEMFFGPQSFLDHGTPIGAQLDGVLEAIRDARSEWGIDGALIVSAHRHRPLRDALDLIDIVEPWSEDIVAFGLGGPEIGNPPATFADYFSRARERGFRTTAHAGEEGPASYVREAVEVCRVDRVDHGLSGIGDEAVMDLLRETATPITMCPISNLRLNNVDSLAEYPLRRALAAGVVATVSSDDPSYFGGYVNDNLVAVHEATDLSLDDMVDLARNSFIACFAEPAASSSWLTEVDDYARDAALG